MDHDRLFKELITTFFIEFVRLFLPDVAQYLDPASIEFLDKEIFTDVASGSRHEVDILVKARFLGFGAGCFLIHVENQASPLADFAERMFRYMARLFEKFRLPIFPVALFSFDHPVRPETDRFQISFPGMTVIDFRFRVIQLNRLNWRDFLRNPNPVAAALMTKMHIEPEDRPRVKMECLRMLATLKLDKARSMLISAFMENYLKLTAAEMVVYNREMDAVAPQEREEIMQLTNEWIEKGRDEGLKTGLAQGRRELVVRLLRKRFGTIPAEMPRQVENLSAPQVDELGEAILGFAELDEAKRWLNSHDPLAG